MTISQAFERSPERAERMLILRMIAVVGLVLLLVAGAWSTSHGASDSHATVCLSSGITPVGGDAMQNPTDLEVLTVDVGVCVIAVLGTLALTVLLQRLRASQQHGARTNLWLATAPRRAGPRVDTRVGLTSLELSISRT